jgi:hypothetical protein
MDRATLMYKMIEPTVFVDDIAADMCGPEKQIVRNLRGFIDVIADFFKTNRLELSSKKSVCTATTKKLGNKLVDKWKTHGIQFCERVKALGVGLAAGCRRNMEVLTKRLRTFAARTAKFRRLRKAGVDTARIVRTGLRGMTYGQSTTGVSDSFLHRQRVTVASMATPGETTCGQNLDLALIIADGSATGRADPAYDAHLLPIGEWSLAVWETWEQHVSMKRMVQHAIKKLTSAKRPWHVCYGPAAAYVLTCWRLKWTVIDAFTVITDEGRELQLRLDPPAVV